MIRCIVIDDEQPALDVMNHYIAQTPQLELLASTTNPLEGLEMVQQLKPDLVFLDIQMPELSGIDFIKAVRGNIKIVLTTAYSEFALESYDLNVTDYLLKPIRFSRFLTAVQKVAEELKPSGTARVAEEDFLFVKTESKGKLVKINLSDIDYIEGMKNYVGIYCHGKRIMVLTTMKELEERLQEKQFLRVHKSFIIPLARLTGIEGNLLRLKDVSAEILVGESYKPELMKIIRDKMVD